MTTVNSVVWSRARGVGPVYRPWILQHFVDRYRVEPWACGTEQPAIGARAA